LLNLLESVGHQLTPPPIEIDKSVMTCTHERIKTWILVETHEPAGMWSCAHCGEKFVPITAALAEKHAAVKRCREIVLEHSAHLYDGCDEACIDIREAFPQAFTDGLPPIPKG